MTTQERLITRHDLERLPDDGRRFELVRGELIEMPPTKRQHGFLMIRLIKLLSIHVDDHDLGELIDNSGYLLAEDPDTVRAPDIAFTRKARLTPMTDEYERTVPDLAIEIVSPSNSAADLQDKVQQYFEAGVQQVWLFFPKRESVHIYRSPKDVIVLDVNDTLDGGALLPGFALKVSDVFAGLHKDDKSDTG